MSRILLTGGLGFIGSHIAVSLSEAGHDIVILDNLQNSDQSVLDSIAAITGKKPALVEGDITDIKTLRQIFSDSQQPINAVVHLAALKSVTESVAEPAKYYKINVGGLLELMRAMKEAGCYNLIFSSSATVYGEATQLPITEQAPIRPTNPYGISKVASEYILKNACADDPNWNVLSLRYFNPAGCHPSALLGEKIDGGSQNLFVAIARYYLVPGYQLKIFGTDYDTRDGTCVRDYVHVADLANAHLLATEKVLAGKVGAAGSEGYVAVNLGSGTGQTVLEVFNAFKELEGKPLVYETAGRRDGDAPASYTSIDLAKSLLNWQPTSDLKTICRDTLRYIKKSLQEQESS